MHRSRFEHPRATPQPRCYDRHDITARAQLPDDIEQKLLDGQRLRATYDLMERRGLTLNEARELVGRWLFERRQPRRGAEPSPGS